MCEPLTVQKIAAASERVIAVENSVSISWKRRASLGSASGAGADRWGVKHKSVIILRRGLG